MCTFTLAGTLAGGCVHRFLWLCAQDFGTSGGEFSTHSATSHLSLELGLLSSEPLITLSLSYQY